MKCNLSAVQARVVLCAIGLASLACGVIFFAWRNEWFVVYIPQTAPSCLVQPAAQYKTVTYTLAPLDQPWVQESERVVWTQDTERNLLYLLSSWCELAQEAGAYGVRGPVQIQQVFCVDSYAYISLTAPIDPAFSTRRRLQILNALLKTVAENISTVSYVYFLVDNKVWEDERLDFSHQWPVSGYGSDLH